MNKKALTILTGNQNKADEVAAILRREVLMKKVSIHEVQALDVKVVAEEKVKAAYSELQCPVIVDDTGMSIEALNGLPGALVSWFLDQVGPSGILKMIKGSKNRTASVVTCIAYSNGIEVETFLGKVKGHITMEEKGENGFGYDTIFIPEGFNKTFAEMTPEEKNSVSMRSIALEKFKIYLDRSKF